MSLYVKQLSSAAAMAVMINTLLYNYYFASKSALC